MPKLINEILVELDTERLRLEQISTNKVRMKHWAILRKGAMAESIEFDDEIMESNSYEQKMSPSDERLRPTLQTRSALKMRWRHADAQAAIVLKTNKCRSETRFAKT